MIGEEVMRRLERDIALQIVDTQWKDHLYSLDHLKEGIGLRGYGQRDPLVEYKKESFALFQDMRGRVEEEIVRWLFSLRPVVEEQQRGAAARGGAARGPTPLTLNNPAAEADSRVRGARGRAPAEGALPRRAHAGADRRRRRAQDGPARGAEGGPQRPVPVRQREEVQEVPRHGRLTTRTAWS